MVKSDAVALNGVFTVLPTPFHPDHTLDLGSLESLVEHSIVSGASGLVCFGLASELYKLTDKERDTILSTVLGAASGRVPVIAGSESNSIETAVQRTAETVEAGATAVMLLPPTFIKPDPETTAEYYREVASAAMGRDVIVQDAPSWTGVPLPEDLLSRIREDSPNVKYVKVESPPTSAKVCRLVASGFACIGGYGAVHLPEEYRAGVTAVMPGAGDVAYSVELWNALIQANDSHWHLYRNWLPLLSFQMSSLDTFIAVQKELLRRRGIIACAAVRRPGRQLTGHQQTWLSYLLDQMKGDLIHD